MEEIRCDVLVIGGGAAGSRAAYEAKRYHPELDVMLVLAGKHGTSGSSALMASESLGINAPFNYMGDGDSPDAFYEDIITTGGGLADPVLCRIIADEACTRMEELIELGLEFDSAGGKPIQRLLSGCTKARSLTCGGHTGREIVRVLKEAGNRLGVGVLENTRVLELLRDQNGKVCGALGLQHGRRVAIKAQAVVLATGGSGRIFRKNVNPPSIEGDGWAMAYQAGARFCNMEFFQVGPAVVNPGIQFIIHSHMWRLNPKLTNSRGEEFLGGYCPENITPKEVLDAKAMSYPFSVRTKAMYLDIGIFKEIMAGRCTANDGIFFDVTHVTKQQLEEKTPITYSFLLQQGLDISQEKIELGLVVQNFNGGIIIDENGYTGVEGLYAAGEVTGGVHGSDRPGGNNLTDTQVFGYRAGKAAAEYAFENRGKKVSIGDISCEALQGSDAREDIILQTCADLYYKEMTIVRRKEGLERVLSFISDNLNDTNSFVLRNRLLVGRILAMPILARKESRGTHYREDYPQTNASCGPRIIISKGQKGEPVVTKA